MEKYGFQSTSDWYQTKNRWKKKQFPLANLPPQPQDLPDYDDADNEEEPEDEPVVKKPTDHSYAIQKVRSYECNCGYSFQSRIPQQLIKCPECGGKPKEEREEEE